MTAGLLHGQHQRRNRYTGANKTKRGPVDGALERLKTIRAKSVKKVSNGKAAGSHA